MSNPSLYSQLSSKESIESDSPLLGSDEVTPLQRGNLRKHLHWVFHSVSGLIIIGLLIGMQKSLQISREKCWDMFNYYCKIWPGYYATIID